jgi:ammonium transporter, Amt family
MHVVVQGIAVPTLAFVAYQMMFAVITPALITGATADRLRFGAYAIFICIWVLVVSVPVAHWLFNPSGWLAKLGAQDWAGGLVVHASAGAAVIAVLLVIGRRRRWPHASTPPHSIPMVVLGAGILWFGWFGFNAGDGLRVDGVAAQALINTQVAAAAAMLLWLLVERIQGGHSTVLGAVTGAVAGLATITPCAGYVSTYSAVAIGAIAGLVCQWALRLKVFLRLDDALDVIAVHFTGGVIGTLLLGFFGEQAINGIGANGVIFGGGATLLSHQALAALVVVVFSFCLTWIIATAIQRTIGLRVDPADENNLDQVQQGAPAYAYGRSSDIMASGDVVAAPAAPVEPAEPAAPGQLSDMRLVSALIDDTDADELRSEIMAAGAVSIALSDASVYQRQPVKETVRGSVRTVEFTPRLRIEIVAPAHAIPAIVAALRTFTGVSPYVQVGDLNLVHTGAS